MQHEEKIVLLTEDELLAAEVVRILHDVDVGVVRAAGAERALELVRELRPKLVLLDAKLTFSGALEACRVLRSEIPPTEFGVLVLVTDADDLSMADLLTNGADDVVSRKLKPWGFKARIASHLRRIGTGRSLAH